MAPVWRGLNPKARRALIPPYLKPTGRPPKELVRRRTAGVDLFENVETT